MSNQLELRHLRYFLAVAEDLHFRKAAERLYISQPGLSRQIKQMENDLGLQLFERHNRKVVLTEAGKYLKNEFIRHFKQLDDAINHAKLLHNGKTGQIELGYVGSAMQKLIPQLLMNYREKKPDVVFSLKEMDNRKQIHALLNFDIDIGFVRLEEVPKTIEKRCIMRDVFCLVLPENHHINDSNFENIYQLKNESRS